MLEPLGSVNGYMPQRATFNGESIIYDGTTRGLERAVLDRGAVAGDKVSTHVLSERTYVLVYNQHITHNEAKVQAVDVRHM